MLKLHCSSCQAEVWSPKFYLLKGGGTLCGPCAEEVDDHDLYICEDCGTVLPHSDVLHGGDCTFCGDCRSVESFSEVEFSHALDNHGHIYRVYLTDSQGNEEPVVRIEGTPGGWYYETLLDDGRDKAPTISIDHGQGWVCVNFISVMKAVKGVL